MPKMKTHRGAAKRFRVTRTGKVMRAKAYHNHILEKKSPKRKRNFRKDAAIKSADAETVKKQLVLA